MNKPPEEYIVDILKHELNLQDTYGTDKDGNIIPCIAVGSQNVLLGTTDKLQIIVWDVWSKVTSNTRLEKEIQNSPFKEIQQTTYCDTIQVDIMSKNQDARNRRFEIAPALKSTYATQLSDKYGFRIYQIPENILNIGQVVGGSAINRWSIRFKMSYLYEFSKDIDYYDKFKFTIQDDTTFYEELTINKEE